MQQGVEPVVEPEERGIEERVPGGIDLVLVQRDGEFDQESGELPGEDLGPSLCAPGPAPGGGGVGGFGSLIAGGAPGVETSFS